MKCSSPIQLKNGLVVPCGKCLLCMSARRDDWSVRLQLHTMSYDKMPFFVTLTYDTPYLKFADKATLCRSDLSLFIKRLKDKFNLYNSSFSYFGCGEYGDEKASTVGIARPHYHIILYGFDALHDAYERSWLEANKLICDVWKMGNVDVGVAEWSGIHYVTKYVLKFVDEDYTGIQKPFIVYSKGLGKNFLHTREGRFLLSTVNSKSFRKVVSAMPELDTSDIFSLNRTALAGLRYLAPHLPKLFITLPSGKKAALPRYLRRKLVGSFEHFKDNPYWLYNSLQQIVESTTYLFQHKEYDQFAEIPYAQQVLNFAEYKIKKRLLQK